MEIKDSSEKERNMILGVILRPNLLILEKVASYFYNKEKVIEEEVSGDEKNEEYNENEPEKEKDPEEESDEEKENNSENDASDFSEEKNKEENIFEEEEENTNEESGSEVFSEKENDIPEEITDEEKSESEEMTETEVTVEESDQKNEEISCENATTDSFSNCDFETQINKEIENEEYSSVSDNNEINNVEPMNENLSNEKMNVELMDDNFLNENLTDDLIINDLQNKEINLEINNEQTCTEAENYFTKTEEEKVKEINKEEFFIALKNNLPDNKKNKYKGDFKSGKKINMKRIVSYFMSDFQKDKIFLRRIKEAKKEYLINIYIDNSKSMLKYKLKRQLIYLFDLLKYSFNKLNLQFTLFSFGEETKEINELNLTFDEERSNILFKEGYNIVLTDGIINQMNNEKTLYLFLNKELRNMKQVICDNGIKVVNYLEMMKVKYCLVDDDNFIEEFGKAIAELIKE